jgi:hypothetical protein
MIKSLSKSPSSDNQALSTGPLEDILDPHYKIIYDYCCRIKEDEIYNDCLNA